MDPVFADHLEITQVVRHLQHLLLEKASLSPEINPGGGFAFHLPPNESIVNLGAYRFGNIWKIKLMPSAAEFKMIPLFWPTPRSDFPDHAVLFSKDNTKLNAPFISVIFQPHPHDPIYNLKINENAPFTKKEVEKLTFVVDVIYCNGAEVEETRGNAILYKGTCVGGECTNFACEDQRLNRFTDYVNASSNIIIKEWLDEISQNSSLLQLHQIRTFTLPISEEETDERILGALELALESPEENGYIIEFIAQEQNFAFEPEDIVEAKELALEPAIIRDGEEKETEDVSLSAKAMAHAMIQKIRKKNKAIAQQPKVREIKPAKSASNYKPPVMSKEEAKALLKKSAMPNDLREKSLNLLDGERLKSKREEDKFFLDMLAHQAKSSGSSAQKASSHGSHHSFKLIKQTDSGGKITFRAATLVSKHGSDANRGNSLGVQQSKLRQLLSPLSQQ